ncbi:MAG: glycosyltransferase [Pseudorhodoplanes sp.]|nr:glycosyltransferase [Pseudorhodoplanes sp.]
MRRTASNVVNIHPLNILVIAPTLDAGAADAAVIDLVRILTEARNRPLVISRGGRLEHQVSEHGAQLIHLDVASKNPFVMLRNAVAIARIALRTRCDLVHVHGRAPAWSAWLACRCIGVPFVTSWYKGFREQNVFKRLYNSVMARGDRVIAVSDQIAEIINDRYGTPWGRINVVPAGFDLSPFDPAAVSPARIETMRRIFGAGPQTKIILAPGRMLRRKGHHLLVKAAQRLKDAGLKDFVCVFVGEDHGHSRYMGELWDLVLATGTADVVRMTGPVTDIAAAYAAACVVVSAATQAEGLQRTILEAQAMARPVVVSDLAAGSDVVLAPPAVSGRSHDRLPFPQRKRCRAGLGAAAPVLHARSDPDGDRPARPGMGTRPFQCRDGGRTDAEALCRRGREPSGRVTAFAPRMTGGRRRNLPQLTCEPFLPILKPFAPRAVPRKAARRR